MAQYSELPVYKASYDLLLAIFHFVKNFTKEFKYTLGEKLKNETLEMLINIYRANRTKGNFYKAIEKQNKLILHHKPDADEMKNFLSSMNSYLGIMKHYKTFKIRKHSIIGHLTALWWSLVIVKVGYQKIALKNQKY